MSHPFRVGEVYANRLGAYEVLSINEPLMTVRYTDGKVTTGQIATLARIWENLQFERAEVEPRVYEVTPRHAARSDDDVTTSASLRPRNKGRQGALFEGLVEHDFQNDVTGTSWRARDNLGGLLAQRLSDVLGAPYQSWAVYRRAHVYIAHAGAHMANREEGIRRAKFFFALDPDGARYGFYIERNSDQIDEDWDWLRFISGLRREASELRQISMVMREHGVTAQPYLSEGDEEGPRLGKLVAGPEGLTWHPAGGEAAATSWTDFAELLSQLDPTLWCDLYFQAEMSKGEAIELGVDIAGRVVRILAGLLPLYTLSLR